MKDQGRRNLLKSLIGQGRLETTLSRAKIIQRQIDHLVVLAKKATLASRRQILTALNDKKLTNKLVDQIAVSLKERQSGFTRIIKFGPRRGDGAMMAKIEFIEWVKAPLVPPEPEKVAEKPVTKQRRQK